MTNDQGTAPERSRLTLLLGLSASAASAGCTVGGKELTNEEQFEIWAARDTRKMKARQKRDAYLKSKLKPVVETTGGEGEGGGGSH